MRFARRYTVPADELERWLAPLDNEIVAEHEVGPGHFEVADGPFSTYRRTVRVVADDPGSGTVTFEQELDYRLDAPFWRVGLEWPMRVRLAMVPGSPRPWWFWVPPDRFDRRASSVLALLCLISVGAGYVGTLLTQTMTYAADEFGANRSAQATVLAAVRVGVLVAVVVTARADRAGRRRQLGIAGMGAALLTLTGAAAPTLAWLGISQAAARGCSTALSLLVGIVAAEEMPRDSRAYAVSLVAMASAFGSGLCLMALRLAEISISSWRLLYVLPVVMLPLVVWVLRRVPESKRFVRAHADAPMSGHGNRLLLLAGSGFLLAVFAVPASGFLNEFLRDDHGFSAIDITIFQIATSTPGGIAIIVGGRLADVRGRRLIGAIGIVGGTLFTVAMFAAGGPSMWLLSLAATMTGALVVPALGVYRPELFPTALRGRASGAIEIITVTGSAAGLLTVGALSDRWGSFGGPMAVVAIAPLVVAVLVLTLFPETAHHTLEELNPEDAAVSAEPDPAATP